MEIYLASVGMSSQLTSVSDTLSILLWIPFLIFFIVGVFKACIHTFSEDKPSAAPEREIKRVNLLESFPVDKSIEDESRQMLSTTEMVPPTQSVEKASPKIDLNKTRSL